MRAGRSRAPAWSCTPLAPLRSRGVRDVGEALGEGSRRGVGASFFGIAGGTLDHPNHPDLDVRRKPRALVQLLCEPVALRLVRDLRRQQKPAAHVLYMGWGSRVCTSTEQALSGGTTMPARQRFTRDRPRSLAHQSSASGSGSPSPAGPLYVGRSCWHSGIVYLRPTQAPPCPNRRRPSNRCVKGQGAIVE